MNVSDLRYFSDTRGPEWNTAIAAALTGAAAAEVGDRSRAAYGFKRARDIALQGQAQHLSDRPITARCCAIWRERPRWRPRTARPSLFPAFVNQSAALDMRLNATTTQEKAWMLRAAYELTRQRTELNILVNGQPGQPRDGAIRLSPNYGQLDAGITLANKGDAVVWRTVSVQGTPAHAAAGRGQRPDADQIGVDDERLAGRPRQPAPERPRDHRAVGADGEQLSPGRWA